MKQGRVDRLLPYDLETEQSVLASVLLETDAFHRALEFVTGADFFRESHRVIWQAMTRLIEAGKPVELVSLRRELAEHEDLEAAGGASYLVNLLNVVPNGANARFYAKVVRELSIRRQLIRVGETLEQRAATAEIGELEHLGEQATQAVMELNGVHEKDALEPVGAILRRVTARMEAGGLQGLMTGYPDLDHLMGGFAPGDMVILAARPSQGKTALALNIAENIVKRGKGVLVVSLEMSADQLGQRLLASQSTVAASLIQTPEGRADLEVWARIAKAVAALNDAPLFVDDTGVAKPEEIRLKAERLSRSHPLALIVVDYVQLMDAGGRQDNEAAALTRISRGLKRAARQLGVPILVLSQLSRDIEKAREREPRLSDLRGSGALEADADVVIFLHRTPRLAHDQSISHEEVKVLVGKNRNGPTGRLGLIFRKEYVRFESIKREEKDGEKGS